MRRHMHQIGEIRLMIGRGRMMDIDAGGMIGIMNVRCRIVPGRQRQHSK